MPSAFEFVVAGPSGLLTAEDRTRIRRRCVQGKNKRKGSRRTLRATKQDAHKKAVTAMVGRVPLSAPVDVALPLAEIVDAQSRETLFKVFAYKTLEHAMSPLKDCVDFTDVETNCFEWLFYDASFLNALLLTGSAINDFSLYGLSQPGTKTYRYLQKTIVLLNEKLAEPDAYTSDSTLYVVVTLAVLAASFSDWRAARAHLAGLRKIIQLRGWLKYLEQRPKLHFKLDRIDLACVLHAGGDPVFASSPVSWGALFPVGRQPEGLHHKPLSLPNDIKERLVVVLHDLQCFTSAMNVKFRRHERWESNSFQTIINSIQSRLLQLPSTPDRPLCECLRLGMLAFLTTTFLVPGRRIPYTHLADPLRKAIQASSDGDELSEYRAIRLWAMMMGAISFLDIESDWFLGAWSAYGPTQKTPWEAVRAQLLSVLWIECVHDELGHMAFRRLSAASQTSGLDEQKAVPSLTPH